jgi:hypothetical protein
VTDHRAGGGRLFLVEFRHQLRRSFSPPFTEPGVVLMNASLVLVLWFWVPIGLRDLFISLHGEMALPMVLASWMYADVPATNLLAPDRERALAVLDRPADLQRLIDAKNVVLWFLVSPVCIALAIGTGIAAANGIRISDAPAPTHSAILPATAIAVLWIAVAPLGALGIASWIGTWFPYHPLPLRTRFQHRRPLRTWWCAGSPCCSYRTEWSRRSRRWSPFRHFCTGMSPVRSRSPNRSDPANSRWVRASPHWSQ